MLSQGDIKINLVPSGDQAGWQAPSGISVSIRGKALPSTVSNHIWVVPLRSEANATCPLPPPKGVSVNVGVIDGRSGVGEIVGCIVAEDVGLGVIVTDGEGVTVLNEKGVGESGEFGDGVESLFIMATGLVLEGTNIARA